jgi:histidinol-phosphate phosphatase family protein
MISGIAAAMTASIRVIRHGGLFDAVLLDRDGTLVRDVPYNGDPDRVVPMPGAKAALDRLRQAGLRLAVVSNQSGVGRGLLSAEAVDRVNDRIDDLLGPFDSWHVCPHVPDQRCGCRKPAPGLVYAAAGTLGVAAQRCVVIGDIGADIAAARAAGATGLLVPTDVTRVVEVAAADNVALTLRAAADWILAREALVRPVRPPAVPGARVLAARTDSAGDVLVCGPAVRALAARAAHVTMLCGPRGRLAAELLPGIDDILEWPLPWIEPDPAQVDPVATRRFVDEVRRRRIDEAVIFTSYHQSALPLALLLRLAGVARISAVSEDYPGSLLDLRHRVPPGVPEPERALSLAAAAGYPLPADDLGGLRITVTPAVPPAGAPVPKVPPQPGPAQPRPPQAGRGGVVLHPGASVPARACPPERCAQIVRALAEAGHQVIVTGGPGDGALTAAVAGGVGVDLGGRTSLAALAELLSGADVLVSGNTGPAHLAAAVGTPVVSLFAPTVPFGQWGPYRVPAVRLGDPLAGCRDTRATRCPVDGHPCLADVDPEEVVRAVNLLARERRKARERRDTGTGDGP